MDHKAKRRKIYKTEEVKIYDASQRNKNRMEESLREVGYRSPVEYSDSVSQYAW